MLSLRALLTAYKTLLVIDSSSACAQIGLFKAGLPSSGEWEKSIGEAGIAVFQNTDKLLRRSGVKLSEIDAIAFCDGPGSVLGIRTAAVAIRTWGVLRSRSIFSFGSLAAVAQGLALTKIDSAFSVIADARRENWHRVSVDAAGKISPLERAPVEQLSGALIMPEGFRHWALPPPHLERVHYNLAQWFPLITNIDLFRPTDSPDAFLHEEPAYQTWTPRIHRAPSKP